MIAVTVTGLKSSSFHKENAVPIISCFVENLARLGYIGVGAVSHDSHLPFPHKNITI